MDGHRAGRVEGGDDPGVAVGDPEFTVVADHPAARFRENWDGLRAVLAGVNGAVSHHEVLAAWPADSEQPSVRQLYGWLSQAAAEGLVVRLGRGTKDKPFRFRMPNDTDAFTLPPLE